MFFTEFKLPAEPSFPDREIVISSSNPTNDITKDLIEAISTISALGGGHVVIPEGNYICGPIHLKSNIDLHLSAGAYVKFKTDPDEYLPVVFTTYGGIRCYNYSPLIYGRGLENVAVTGEGVFDGSGDFWWTWAKNMTAREVLYHGKLPVEKRIFGTPEYGLRPMFLQVLESKGVLISGVKFINSPVWTVNTVWCEDVIVRGVTIENPLMSPNTDGVNIESCNRALVEDCTVISGGDDMFCIKAGRNEDGWEVGIPCENVVIRNCRSVSQSRSGGVVIGSEMSAGVRNILAENCSFAHNLNCIRIKSKDGRGGYVENVDFRNITMQKGMRGINLSYRYSCEATDDAEFPGKHMPRISNVSFENISCNEVEQGIAIDGIPNGIMENVSFKDISMNAEKCFSADTVSGLYMENVNLTQITK